MIRSEINSYGQLLTNDVDKWAQPLGYSNF